MTARRPTSVPRPGSRRGSPHDPRSAWPPPLADVRARPRDPRVRGRAATTPAATSAAPATTAEQEPRHPGAHPGHAPESVRRAFRINLIVPSVSGASTFGGVQTAIDLFRVVSAGGVRRRIISVEALDAAAVLSFAEFEVVDWPTIPMMTRSSSRSRRRRSPRATCRSRSLRRHDRHDRRASRRRPTAPADPAPVVLDAAVGALPSRLAIPPDRATRRVHRDLLADGALRLRGSRMAGDDLRRSATAVAYLIQDFEPGFYARSAQSLLSNSTYDTPSSTIAIFNSSLLQREFHDIGSAIRARNSRSSPGWPLPCAASSICPRRAVTDDRGLWPAVEAEERIRLDRRRAADVAGHDAGRGRLADRVGGGVAPRCRPRWRGGPEFARQAVDGGVRAAPADVSDRDLADDLAASELSAAGHVLPRHARAHQQIRREGAVDLASEHLVPPRGHGPWPGRGPRRPVPALRGRPDRGRSSRPAACLGSSTPERSFPSPPSWRRCWSAIRRPARRGSRGARYQTDVRRRGAGRPRTRPRSADRTCGVRGRSRGHGRPVVGARPDRRDTW